jgi:hypothetical protein
LDERREVQILIGKRLYRMQTELDEGTLSKVTDIVTNLARALGEDINQDHLLMLMCLQLAYNLEKISMTLKPLQEKLDNLTPWEPLNLDNEEEYIKKQ